MLKMLRSIGQAQFTKKKKKTLLKFNFTKKPYVTIFHLVIQTMKNLTNQWSKFRKSRMLHHLKR